MIQENLKRIRKKKGISQEKMAKILGMDTSNYSRKERGEVKIFDNEWKKLAKTLEVCVEDIKNNDPEFPFQFKNTAFHNYSEKNIIYSEIPALLVETQKKYIEKLEKENTELLHEISLLKTQNKV